MVTETPHLYNPEPVFLDFVYAAHLTRVTHEIISFPRNVGVADGQLVTLG